MNLRDKRQDTNKGTDFIRYAYLQEDVREAVDKLKYQINADDEFDILALIDEIFGKDLSL